LCIQIEYAMSILEKAGLLIYRFKERGLEIFLVNSDDEFWELPQGKLKGEVSENLAADEKLIELDPVKTEDGVVEEACAFESDWHEIPSLKSMLLDDAKEITDKFAEMEKGSFFVLKDAFQKILPHQYRFLKELRDVLRDRNSLKNL